MVIDDHNSDTKVVLWNREGNGTRQAEEQPWVDAYLHPSILEVYSQPTLISQGVGMNERGVSTAYENVRVDLVYYVFDAGNGEKITIPAP